MKSVKWLIYPVLFVLLLGGPALAEDKPPPGSQQGAGEPALGAAQVDKKAMAILKRMAERLAQAKGFSVAIRSGYDVVQASGEKIEYGEQRKVTLSRPHGLRVEAEQSDGERRLVIFDGRTISIYDPHEKVYARLEKAGSVDEVVRYLVQDLQTRLPLAQLLVTSLPADLERRIQSLSYVEEDRLTAVPTDHLAGRAQDVDFQIWIAREGKPLPRRLVLTYKHEEGQPQFWALFSDWKLSPQVPATQFAFTPPAGAERIPFLIRVPKRGNDTKDRAGQKGGVQ
jgi:hypothetical protein